MARKPKEVRGIKFRPDRGTWEAQYKADGSTRSEELPGRECGGRSGWRRPKGYAIKRVPLPYLPAQRNRS